MRPRPGSSSSCRFERETRHYPRPSGPLKWLDCSKPRAAQPARGGEQRVAGDLAPWLAKAIKAGRHHIPVPLPILDLEQYTAIAIVEIGLVVTVYAPDGISPLVTFGVAQRSRQGGPLWEMLTEHFPGAAGLSKPDEPWCAVAVHPNLVAYPDANEWLGDFERCVAWAWITRNPQIEAV